MNSDELTVHSTVTFYSHSHTRSQTIQSASKIYQSVITSHLHYCCGEWSKKKRQHTKSPPVKATVYTFIPLHSLIRATRCDSLTHSLSHSLAFRLFALNQSAQWNEKKTSRWDERERQKREENCLFSPLDKWNEMWVRVLLLMMCRVRNLTQLVERMRSEGRVRERRSARTPMKSESEWKWLKVSHSVTLSLLNCVVSTAISKEKVSILIFFLKRVLSLPVLHTSIEGESTIQLKNLREEECAKNTAHE